MNGFEGLSAREINNKNINPELRKFLDDKILSSNEAKILLKILKKHRNERINYSKYNLQKLVKVIGIRKRINVINETVLNKIRQIANGTRKSVKNILKYKKNNKKFEKNDISRSYLIKKIDRLLMIKKSCFSKIVESFKSKVNVKLNNISRKIKILQNNPKKIRLFQENAKLLGWYKGNIDGEWGRLTEKAFDKYLNAKGLNRSQLRKLKQIIDKKKKYNLDKATLSHHPRNKESFGKGGKYEGFNERDIEMQLNFEKRAIDFFKKFNLVGRNRGSISKRELLRKIIKRKTGLDIYKSAWCAATVGTLMKMSGYSLHNVGNIHSALAYAGLSSYGTGKHKTQGHIGISSGDGKYWSGNSITNGNGIINNKTIRKDRLIGWIMPKYAGLYNKLHRTGKPPKGAIVIFRDYREFDNVFTIKNHYGKVIDKRRKGHKRKTAKRVEYYTTPTYTKKPQKINRDPLKALNDALNNN